MSADSPRLSGLPAPLAQRVHAAAQALQQGQLDAAERALDAVSAGAPTHPEVLRLRGTVQILRGRAAEAIPILLQAGTLRPDDPLIQSTLGNAYEAVRDHARAEAALRRACELGPERPPYWFNLGRFLYGLGQIEAALPALQRTLELAPQHTHARSILASILSLDGRRAEAEEQYRQILAQEPTCGSAWWGLAQLRPMPLGSADIATMRALPLQRASADDRIAIGYALAHALEQRGDYGDAFAAFTEANARARQRKPWNAADFTAQLDRILEAFGKPAPPASSGAGDEVIFVVSLPRSGSTLVEQILASHSQVEGTAELPDLPQVIAAESRRLQQPFPQWAATHSAEQWQRLGQEYLQRTQRWRERRPRSTDKMPGNWLYAGAIARMLPNARIIVVRRDPLETCFGCYRYLFTQHPYTHDFSDLAAAWRGFDRACRQWLALQPLRVREQSYEQLVAAPEEQIRQLLEFCALPFEPACLNFDATSRRVVTASAGQVRERLRGDTARAPKYGALLDPLRLTLGLPATAL
jgi:tetratricopeptide (TPR) repeat protein